MTAARRLLDRQLPGGLDKFVTDRRKRGDSWQSIARDIDEVTSRVDAVTGNTLRRWYPHTQAGSVSVPTTATETMRRAS